MIAEIIEGILSFLQDSVFLDNSKISKYIAIIFVSITVFILLFFFLLGVIEIFKRGV